MRKNAIRDTICDTTSATLVCGKSDYKVNYKDHYNLDAYLVQFKKIKMDKQKRYAQNANLHLPFLITLKKANITYKIINAIH